MTVPTQAQGGDCAYDAAPTGARGHGPPKFCRCRLSSCSRAVYTLWHIAFLRVIVTSTGCSQGILPGTWLACAVFRDRTRLHRVEPARHGHPTAQNRSPPRRARSCTGLTKCVLTLPGSGGRNAPGIRHHNARIRPGRSGVCTHTIRRHMVQSMLPPDVREGWTYRDGMAGPCDETCRGAMSNVPIALSDAGFPPRLGWPGPPPGWPGPLPGLPGPPPDGPVPLWPGDPALLPDP